jgi:hypothetical protein
VGLFFEVHNGAGRRGLPDTHDPHGRLHRGCLLALALSFDRLPVLARCARGGTT